MNNKLSIIAALLLLSVCSTYAQSRYSGRGDRSVNTREDFQAEDEYEVRSERSALRTTWLAGSPGDNWFLSVFGGPAFLGSENYSEMYLKDNLSFNGGFTLGKWFSPVWGLGLHTSMSRAKSIGFADEFWYIGQHYTNDKGVTSSLSYFDGRNNLGFIKERIFENAERYTTKSGGNAWMYKFTYATVGLDFMVSLRNLFLPYNPKAVLDPVIYGGLGLAHTFKDGNRTAVNSIYERFGLQFNFRFNDYLGANLTFEDMMLPEVFDRQVGGDLTQDHVMSANIGLTFYFGGRNFSPASINVSRAREGRLQTYDDDCREILQCEINALRTPQNRRRYNDPPVVTRPARRATPPVEIEEEEEEEEEEVSLPYDDDEVKVGELRASARKELNVKPEADKEGDTSFDLTPVFFEAGSFFVRTSQMISIAKAAVYLDINPRLKLEISAFADKRTGNPHDNLKLSEQRAKAVANLLISKFGIRKERLHTTFYGDVIQPFPNNDQNRVVLFVKE